MNCGHLSTLNGLLTLAGLAFGIIGSLLMANVYFAVAQPNTRFKILFGSLWRSQLAKGAARVKEANNEDVLRSLQGLAFLALGFICQLASFVLEHFIAGPCKVPG